MESTSQKYLIPKSSESNHTMSGPRAEALMEEYEKRPDPVELTHNPDPSKNSSTGVDYEPYPEKSIQLEPERERIVQSICNLYSGSASEEDMQVYAEESVYDDPWSFCDTRYKIAGQWYGMSKSTLSSRRDESSLIIPYRHT